MCVYVPVHLVETSLCRVTIWGFIPTLRGCVSKERRSLDFYVRDTDRGVPLFSSFLGSFFRFVQKSQAWMLVHQAANKKKRKVLFSLVLIQFLVEKQFSSCAWEQQKSTLHKEELKLHLSSAAGGVFWSWSWSTTVKTGSCVAQKRWRHLQSGQELKPQSSEQKSCWE